MATVYQKNLPSNEHHQRRTVLLFGIWDHISWYWWSVPAASWCLCPCSETRKLQSFVNTARSELLSNLLYKLLQYFSFCCMTRFSFMGRGWRGISVYPSILRSKNYTAYRMDKEPFSPVASTKATLTCSSAMSGVSLAGHPRSRSLPSPANLQSTGPNLRGQPNKEEWAKVTATRYLKNTYIVDKKGPKQIRFIS